ERIAPDAQLLCLLLLLAPCAIAVERNSNRVQEILLAYRLCEELDRSGLHGPYRHGDVAMARYENNWRFDLRLGQLGLKVEPAQSRHSHVQYETAHIIGRLALEEFRGRTKDPGLHADGFEQNIEPLTDVGIVVNHKDGCSIAVWAVHGCPPWFSVASSN